MKKIIFLLLMLLTLTACNEKITQTDMTPDEPHAKGKDLITKATPLMTQIQNLISTKDSYCTKEMNDTELQRILGDKATAEKFTEKFKQYLLIGAANKVCKKDKDVYALIVPAEDPSFEIAIWKDEDKFSFFHDEKNKTKYFSNDGGVITLLPGAQGNNSFVYSAAQDLPIFSWAVDSLDPDKLLVTQIESCKLTFSANADASTLSCDKQYKP